MEIKIDKAFSTYEPVPFDSDSRVHILPLTITHEGWTFELWIEVDRSIRPPMLFRTLNQGEERWAFPEEAQTLLLELITNGLDGVYKQMEIINADQQIKRLGRVETHNVPDLPSEI